MHGIILGGTLGGKKNCPSKILPGKILSNPYFVWEKFCPVQLGVEKYIDRRKASEIFENFWHIANNWNLHAVEIQQS
jgi:hypothetical protein